jgi:lipoprotein-anchoring transpeptidase ErfK/SrfK
MTSTAPRNRTPTSRFARVGILFAASALALVLLVPAGASGSGAAKPAKRVEPAVSKVHYPVRYTLTDDKIGHWAVVLKAGVAAHREPNGSSPVVTKLSVVTSDGTQNLVLILAGQDVDAKRTWYKVRLPILPNNSTGWVPRSALGNLYTVHTHLYVDRKTFTATLKRSGRTIFKTRIGVGRTYWPTPAGQFYIRDKLSGFDNPIYGPVAFGTSARSAVLTDWPGGGFVGVHGTNEPHILPGAVSHGCIRMLNESIVKLAKLMQVGTPLTVT